MRRSQLEAKFYRHPRYPGRRYSIRYVCDKCGSQIFGTQVFNRHLAQCASTESYNFQNCYTNAYQADDYDSDDVIPVPCGQYKYSCICCNFETNFKTHIQNHSVSHDRMCPFCFTWRPGKADLFKHLEGEHYNLQLQEINKVLDARYVGAGVIQLGRQVADLIDRLSETRLVDPCHHDSSGMVSQHRPFSYLDTVHQIDRAVNPDITSFYRSDSTRDILPGRISSWSAMDGHRQRYCQDLPMDVPVDGVVPTADDTEHQNSVRVVEMLLKDLIHRAVNIGICNQFGFDQDDDTSSSSSESEFWDKDESFYSSDDSDSASSHTVVTLEDDDDATSYHNDQENDERKSSETDLEVIFTRRRRGRRNVEIFHPKTPPGRTIDGEKITRSCCVKLNRTTISQKNTGNGSVEQGGQIQPESSVVSPVVVGKRGPRRGKSDPELNRALADFVSSVKISADKNSTPEEKSASFEQQQCANQSAGGDPLEEQMARLFEEESQVAVGEQEPEMDTAGKECGEQMGRGDDDGAVKVKEGKCRAKNSEDNDFDDDAVRAGRRTTDQNKKAGRGRRKKKSEQPLSKQADDYDEMRELENYMKTHHMIPKETKKRGRPKSIKATPLTIDDSQSPTEKEAIVPGKKDGKDFKEWLLKHERIPKRDQNDSIDNESANKPEDSPTEKQDQANLQSAIKDSKPDISAQPVVVDSGEVNDVKKSNDLPTVTTTSNRTANGVSESKAGRKERVGGKRPSTTRPASSITRGRSDHDLPLKKRAIVEASCFARPQTSVAVPAAKKAAPSTGVNSCSNKSIAKAPPSRAQNAKKRSAVKQLDENSSRGSNSKPSRAVVNRKKSGIHEFRSFLEEKAARGREEGEAVADKPPSKKSSTSSVLLDGAASSRLVGGVEDAPQSSRRSRSQSLEARKKLLLQVTFVSDAQVPPVMRRQQQDVISGSRGGNNKIGRPTSEPK